MNVCYGRLSRESNVSAPAQQVYNIFLSPLFTFAIVMGSPVNTLPYRTGMGKSTKLQQLKL